MSPDVLETALLAAAHEHCLANDFDVACRLAEERVELQQTEVSKARARAWLAYFESRENDLPVARSVAELALVTLREKPASEECALALAVLAWVSMVEGDLSGGVDHAGEAVAIARAAGSARVEVHAATTLGTCRVLLGDGAGKELIEDAVRLGLENGADEWTAKSMNNLAFCSAWSGDLNTARDLFADLVEFTAARELDAWYIAAVASRATLDVRLGRWEEADRGLATVLGQKTCRQTEAEALITAATLSGRRGDAGTELMIESIIDRVRGSRDFEINLTAALLAMEAAWLGVIETSEGLAAYHRALQFGALADDAWARAMLAFWARRLEVDPPPGEISGPSGLELEGRMREAAEAWDRAGYAIEAAICRALTPGADLDQVFSSLAAMGAEGVALGLRRELKRRGVGGVPRGERRSTRAHPAGLTARQAEVLSLMRAGLSNAAIAEALFISEKTAGHHVSAILAKLNVSSRLQAVAVTSDDAGDHARV
jgi:DNA-binding CsgD family transcriptional regulator